MRYPYAVKYNGIIYPANTEIPEEKAPEEKAPEPKKAKESKTKGGAK